MYNCVSVFLHMAAINAFAEVHGPQSKCVDFRIDSNSVFANSTVPPIYGGACYNVSSEYMDTLTLYTYYMLDGIIAFIIHLHHSCDRD